MKKEILNNELKEYWLKNPDKFIEDYFGLRLFSYQKKMINVSTFKCLQEAAI